MRFSICGIRLLPISVREYSTFGGISAYTFLEIKPSHSRLFKVSVKTLGEISGIALLISLKRVASFSDNTQRTSIDHLPEKRAIIFLTGQESMPVYFSNFL